MTWNPVLPVWAVLLIVLVLGGAAVVALVRAPDRARRLNWIGRVAVVVLLGLALLRPGIGTQATPTVQSDVDVMFVVDTTASMVAEDWDGKPRMDGVKADIAALAEAHAGARFGLIAFGAAPTLRLPFTSDASALQSLVTTLTTEVTKYSQGSSIGIANKQLERTLKRAQEADPNRARIVYYLGDGEQTAATSPESFSSSASRIQGGAVLGYGTAEGGPMLSNDGAFATTTPTYITDNAGNVGISHIDEANLQAIATDLGVGYQHRTPDTAVQPVAVDTSALQTQEGGDVERAFDLYWILAIMIFVILLREVWVLTRGLTELYASSKGVRP